MRTKSLISAIENAGLQVKAVSKFHEDIDSGTDFERYKHITYYAYGEKNKVVWVDQGGNALYVQLKEYGKETKNAYFPKTIKEIVADLMQL